MYPAVGPVATADGAAHVVEIEHDAAAAGEHCSPWWRGAMCAAGGSTFRTQGGRGRSGTSSRTRDRTPTHDHSALLGFGVAAAVPTVLAGLVEWQATTGAARRVGVVHAVVNGSALALYTASLAARLSDRHARAVMSSVGRGVVATVGGYLGGHLSLVLKVGTGDRALGSPDLRAASPGG